MYFHMTYIINKYYLNLTSAGIGGQNKVTGGQLSTTLYSDVIFLQICINIMQMNYKICEIYKEFH